MSTSSKLPPIIDADQLRDLIAESTALSGAATDGAATDDAATDGASADGPSVGGAPASRPLRLLDVRWALDGSKGRSTYRAGHIPGAVYVDLESELAAPASPQAGRHPLPPPEEFAATLRRAGVDDGMRIVVYDDTDGAPSGRLVWMLRALGHDAAVLSGGLAAWTGGADASPHDLEIGDPTHSPAAGNVTAREWSSAVIATIDEVAAASTAAGSAAAEPAAAGPAAAGPAAAGSAAAGPAASGSSGAESAGAGSSDAAETPLIIDARAAARYRGETEPVDPRAGHVPGAVNLPYPGNLDEEGRFLPPPALRERFESVGAREDREIIVYCGSGVTATHDILALQRAGFTKVRLFPGSWSQWSADPTRPLETGTGR